MSRRSMTKKNGMIGVKTTNGQETFSASVYRTSIKEYNHPLPNGFNLELANDVYQTIKDNQNLWSQGNWRAIKIAKSLTGYQDIRDALVFDLPETTFVCGTAMCFAGWVKELSQPDWLIDGNWLKKGAEQGSDYFAGFSLSGYGDYLLMRRDSPEYQAGDCRLEIKYLPAPLVKDLKERGFTDESHCITLVDTSARRSLGIGRDPLHLFGATNSMERIKATIDYYAENGATDLTIEQLDYFFETHGDGEENEDYDDDDDEDEEE